MATVALFLCRKVVRGCLQRVASTIHCWSRDRSIRRRTVQADPARPQHQDRRRWAITAQHRLLSRGTRSVCLPQTGPVIGPAHDLGSSVDGSNVGTKPWSTTPATCFRSNGATGFPKHRALQNSATSLVSVQEDEPQEQPVCEAAAPWLGSLLAPKTRARNFLERSRNSTATNIDVILGARDWPVAPWILVQGPLAASSFKTSYRDRRRGNEAANTVPPLREQGSCGSRGKIRNQALVTPELEWKS